MSSACVTTKLKPTITGINLYSNLLVQVKRSKPVMSLARFLLELKGRGAKSVETRTICVSAFPVGGAIFMFHTPNDFPHPQPIFFYLAGAVAYIYSVL